jgi:hypothetical protein
MTGLRISEADDAHEREADRVAQEVVSGRETKRHWSLASLSSGGSLQRKCSCGAPGGSGGECEECKQHEGAAALQRKAVAPGGSDFAPPIVREVLNSPGQPLPQATREFFEPRFRHDFGNVRLHADSRAADSARSVGALAYTVGNDIVFGHGQYSPQSAQGRRLLAHELTHTIQQRPVLSRACDSADDCKKVLKPTQLLEKVAANPTNKSKQEQRAELCRKGPQSPGCMADGHGAAAVETEKLLHAYEASRPQRGVKIVVDNDMPAEFGAVTISCKKLVPPVAGATDCIAVPHRMEDEAGQFNNTMDPKVGGKERGEWRERTLEILVHESEHARFREARRGNRFPAIDNTACADADTISAMSELSAMLTEFATRMERIRGSVNLSPEAREKEMEKWREHRILGEQQSITVSLRTVRCKCDCADAEKMIREAVDFTLASWTKQDKDDLHRELRSPRWKDLNLRWPYTPSSAPKP